MGDPHALPEHPALRQVAMAFDAGGLAFELLDARFRCVYLSRELAQILELTPDEVSRQVGRSQIVRATTEDSDIIRVNRKSGAAWFEHNAPILRRYLDPADADFAQIFGPMADAAREVEPAESTPRAWHDLHQFPASARFRFQRTLLGAQHQVQLRINDDDGQFLGTLVVYRPTLRESLLLRLGRGDQELFERMDRVSEPARRTAAILFADLEASSAQSRRLSSRGYFELIRDLTALIDNSILAQDGITGKHAGDGGSALFLTADFEQSESGAARAAVEAARRIRDGSARLGPDDVTIKVNVGLHWGSTLVIGQIATQGRLEVTALGDQMNECARIEAAAVDGAILASKDLIERLASSDAEATGIDPDLVSYATVGELVGTSDKVARDAGTIPVAAI